MEQQSVKLKFPYTAEQINNVKVGELIYISGPMIVMRDAAHKRFKEILEQTKKMPFDISGKIIYYMGPTPTQEGKIIGSCGPTTSKRMDSYVDLTLKSGAFAILGKGARNKEATENFIKNKKVYLVAVGGAGAYYSKCVKSVKEIAFNDLLAEAVIEIEVEKFPCFMAIDMKGNNLFSQK